MTPEDWVPSLDEQREADFGDDEDRGRDETTRYDGDA